MKQAKFALTAVAVLAVIGGALAFKASRTTVPFYSLGAYTINGAPTSACVVKVDLLKRANPAGALTPYSSVINTTLPTTTCSTRVVDAI